jgi:uncharacterized protein (DUF433 family)
MAINTRSLLERIARHPQKFGGKPTVRNTSITVELVFALLASGASYDGVLRSLPELESDDIFACFAYAQHLTAEGWRRLDGPECRQGYGNWDKGS